MPAVSNVTRTDLRPAKNRTGLHWQTIAVGVAVFGVMAYLTTDETGLVASAMCFGFLTIIQTKAESRRASLSEPRFWAILAVFAVVHILALWYVRVPELKFGLMIAPFGFADFYAMWWLIEWVERRFPVRSPQ